MHSRKTLHDVLDGSLPGSDTHSDTSAYDAGHDGATVLVFWCNAREHFEALVRLESTDAAKGRVRYRGLLQASCIAEDRAAVDAIMRQYVHSCAARNVDVTRI
jgi:hypothetical protein